MLCFDRTPFLACAVLLASGGAVSVSSAQETLLSEDFAGSGGALNGADAESGGSWIASAGWGDDGAVTGVQDGSAVLPFSPVVDAQYTLRATVTNTTDQWIALGFSRDSLTSPGGSVQFNDRFSNDLEGIAWMLYRDAPSANDIEVFSGLRTSGGLFGGDVAGVDFSTPTELRIEIDTTGDGSSFTADFFVGGQSVTGGPVSVAVPVSSINFAGLSFDANGSGGVSVSGFSMEAVGHDGGGGDGGIPLADHVTESAVYPYGYSRNSINSVAFSRSNLITEGDYQYIAFYSALASARMQIGRREIGTDDWTVLNTGMIAYNVADDHDNINLAIDGNGHLHVSWGMHNNPMLYNVSDNPVTGEAFDPGVLTFSQPSFWQGTFANHDSSVTYPEFYKIPGTGDLLFIYRQGESGNGDTYFTRYDHESESFDRNLVMAGSQTSVNAYLNRLVYAPDGDLQATWTWRDTPAFQSNENIMFARSGDDGVSWSDSDGNAYGLPITQPEAEVVAPIPQGSSLINQTDMTVDSEGNPYVATWYAPLAGQGSDTRQYMLHWSDGESWHVAQLSDRIGQSSSHERSDSNVRDLARPVVLKDAEDRTYVIMRYDEESNHIVVAYSADGNQTWEYVKLSETDMGDWEPSYDAERWRRDNVLQLYFQPGLGSGNFQPVSVLEWDTNAFFGDPPACTADLAEPFGVLDLNDITTFVTAFTSQDPVADIAAPFGTFDLADLTGFVSAFTAGCP